MHHDTKEMSGEDRETGGSTMIKTDQHVEIDSEECCFQQVQPAIWRW